MRERLASVAARGEDGKFAPSDIAPPANPEVYGMVYVLYLDRAGLYEISADVPQSRSIGRQAAFVGIIIGMDACRSHEWSDFPQDDDCCPNRDCQLPSVSGNANTYSFGHFRIEEDVSGMRSAGSQSWAGVLNTHYWFDIKKDVAAVIMT